MNRNERRQAARQARKEDKGNSPMKGSKPALNSANLKVLHRALQPGGTFGLKVSEKMTIQLSHDRLGRFIQVLEKYETQGSKLPDLEMLLEEMEKLAA